MTIRTILFAAALLATTPAHILAQPMPTGMWAVTRSYDVYKNASLVVERRGAAWTAALQGQQVTFRSVNGDVAFAFPDSSRFRGRISGDGSVISGMWIQPQRRSGTYRGQTVGKVPEYNFASPLTLSASSKNTWAGTVVPLEDVMTLEVHFRSRGNETSAFLRNPEYNVFVEREYRVTTDGGRITIANPEDSTDIRYGTYNAERIALYMAEVEDTLVLQRRAAPQPARYVYRAPQAQRDGWSTASLGDVGIDTAQIVALVQRILNMNANTTSVFSPDIHSLIIARHGKIVLEEYFRDYNSERVHDSRSLGKTFAAGLVGAALLRGADLAPDRPVMPIFANYGATANPDARKSKLQLRHFMTMTTGHACDENDEKQPGNEDKLQSSPERDWYRFSLDVPLREEPGRKYAYCSGTANVVGGVVERVTGAWLPQFFDSTFAQPLDFQRYYLQLTPAGTAYLGGGSYFRPRDMLKLGQVFLSGGEWNGRRVLPREWTALATRADPSVNTTREGYHWHLTPLEAYGREWTEWNANGNGGQMVLVYPELDLVVGWTAGNYMNGGTWLRYRSELTAQHIIAAVAR